jgi:small GTP-binding protein
MHQREISSRALILPLRKATMEKAASFKKKICLLGSFAVGKTSLVARFVHNRFDEKYLTTIGVNVTQKTLPPLQNLRNGPFHQYTFLIWDIASMEKFDSVVVNYYRGAAGALAVADLTRPETISHLQDLCGKLHSVAPEAELLILGNKSDLFQRDGKTTNLLEETASGFSTKYLLTSAKTGERVEEAFLTLAKRIGRH